MVLRAHPNEALDFRPYREISPRIVTGGQEKFEDVLELLPLADAIITDYSSIYIEGLLIDIPAIFLPYDVESYERGFPLPYDQITPGPKVYFQRELQFHLERALERTDGRESERRQVRELYFADAGDTDGDGTGSDQTVSGRLIRFLEKKLL